jgi:hypothetical protein
MLVRTAEPANAQGIVIIFCQIDTVVPSLLPITGCLLSKLGPKFLILHHSADGAVPTPRNLVMEARQYLPRCLAECSGMVLPRYLTALSQFSQAPFYSKRPTLSGLGATKEIPSLVALEKRDMQLSNNTFAVLAVALASALPPILKAFGSEVPFVEPNLWWLLVIGALFSISELTAVEPAVALLLADMFLHGIVQQSL